MTNLIIFNIGIALLVGLGLFLVRNSDRMARERREAPKCRQQARQAELRRKLREHQLLDVIRVTPTPDFKLLLEFENGEHRVFDMSPLMNKKPFDRLKGSPLFMKAYVDYGTVVWPGNIDIAPETLYDRSKTLRT